MAQARVCPHCEERHFNFQKCRVRENKREGVSFSTIKPNLPPGYRPWNRDYLPEGYEKYGDLLVQKSDLRLKPHGGTITEPKENP